MNYLYCTVLTRRRLELFFVFYFFFSPPHPVDSPQDVSRLGLEAIAQKTCANLVLASRRYAT